MAILINEQRMIEENSFKYSERLKSPLSRFLDVTPTFVTYYHVDTVATSTDAGYADVQNIIGTKSPIRFKKIENFPLYGLDQVVVALQSGDAGIDGSYEGDAIIAAGTIKPLANDYFTIPSLNNEIFIFRITDIAYDVAVNNNSYKISYMLEFNDDDKAAQLREQVISEYKCILQNIGTENECIVEKSNLSEINRVEKIYDKLAELYVSIFYSEKHNVFLGEIGPNRYIYDIYQTIFINKHSLFNKRNNLQALILTEQFHDNKEKIKYEKSIYRLFERQDIRLLSNFFFCTYHGSSRIETSFARWYDETVDILDMPIDDKQADITPIFSNEFKESIRLNGPQPHGYARLMQAYVRGEALTLNSVPDNLHEDMMFNLDANLEMFFFTPIVLYILRQIINKAYSKNTEE